MLFILRYRAVQDVRKLATMMDFAAEVGLDKVTEEQMKISGRI